MKHIITKRTAQKWANALRSGKYQQTTDALQNEQGFCCLGVACDIFIPKSKQVRGKATGYLVGGMPEDHQDHAPQWLKGINGDLKLRNPDPDHYNYTLAELNDSGYSFNEIADIIELVYVHKALD